MCLLLQSVVFVSSLMEEAEECHELIQTLPKVQTPYGRELYLYEGFWCPSFSVHGVISFQKNFEAYDTDLMLITNPKAGTTWLKALTFVIANRAKYPLGESPLLVQNSQDLIPNLENEVFGQNPIYKIEDFSSPRILSTHVSYLSLPRSVRESSCRMIYLCRNPMDQLISLLHFASKLSAKRTPPNANMILDEAFDMLCKGVSIYGPFWDHILSYWAVSQAEPQRVLFLKYEDLKEDNLSNIKVLANFMGCPFSAEEEAQGVIEEISRLCSFDHLKNLEVNKVGRSKYGVPNSAFFREGNVGGWSTCFSPDMIERMVKLLDEKFGTCGLKFRLY